MNRQVQILSKNKLKLIIAVFMIGIFVLGPSLKALADSSEGSGTETQNSTHTGDSSGTHSGESEDRQVQQDVNTGDGSAHFQSELQSGNVKNSFQFELQTHEKVELSFSYKSESSNSHNAVEMKFELSRLIEFVDNTTNPNNIVNGYDKMDTFVQQINFENLTWNLGYTTTTSGSQTLYTVDVNATQGSMVIALTFFITTGFVNQGNITLVPNAVKFDLSITNFPFKNPNGLLAAEVKIKNNVQNKQIENDTEDHKDGYAGKQQQVSFANNSAGAYLSWAQTYLADGANKSIVVSPVVNDHEDDGTQAKMFFSFSHANDIFWDPSVGVTRSSMISTNSSPGFEVITLFLAIPIIALFTRRFNKNRKN